MEKSKKIKIDEIREKAKFAKNVGELRELQTMAEMYTVKYNPTASGNLMGDIELANGTQVQVKSFDGIIPGETTGNILEDLRKALEEDASPVWVIWFNAKEYIVIEKWDLFNHIAKHTEDLIKYNVRDGKKQLRLKMGPQKRKFFFNHPGMKKAKHIV